jgi:hypothetical protein
MSAGALILKLLRDDLLYYGSGVLLLQYVLPYVCVCVCVCVRLSTGVLLSL